MLLIYLETPILKGILITIISLKQRGKKVSGAVLLGKPAPTKNPVIRYSADEGGKATW